LIEVMLSIGVLTVAALLIHMLSSDFQKQSIRNVKRWQAQLVAESVSDIVTSLSNEDLYAALVDPTVLVESPNTYDLSAMSWMSYWKGKSGIVQPDGVTLKAKILDPVTKAPVDITALAAADLHKYYRDTEAVVRFRRDPNAPVETLTYSKSLAPLVRPTFKSASIVASAGNRFACVTRSDAQVKCWEAEGGIARLAPLRANYPAVFLAAGRNVSSVATSSGHGCVLDSDGTVQCWGSNSSGQIGVPLATAVASDPTTPSPPPPNDFPSVTTGTQFTCGLSKGTSRVTCWGSGTGLSASQTAITPTSTLIDQISAGGSMLHAVVNDGTVYGGAPSTGFDAAGNRIAGVVTATSVSTSTSGGHACARTASGGAQCWGTNDKGQLGNGNTTASPSTAVTVLTAASTPLQGVVSVSTGDKHSCALLETGAVHCWGDNSRGQIGSPVGGMALGGSALFAQAVSGLPSVSGPPPKARQAIFAGANSSCVAFTDGEIRCWGVAGGTNGGGGVEGTGSNVPNATSCL
jgi:alpha-tubulin suppressor-like RCC1 family protein